MKSNRMRHSTDGDREHRRLHEEQAPGSRERRELARDLAVLIRRRLRLKRSQEEEEEAPPPSASAAPAEGA